MSDPRTAELQHWLRTHHGVVPRAALAAMGYSSRAIRRLVDNGHLDIVVRGIYRSPAHPWDRIQTMTAACMHVPDGAIGFTSAGQELGFRGMRDPSIHLLVPHGSTPSIPGVVVHRSRQIDPVDLAGRRPDGIRITSPPRTLIDAAALIGFERTASVIEQALADRRLTIPTLMSTSRRLHHGNRPGAQIFEAVLASRPTWRGAARSELEREVRAAIEAAGLPAPQVNHPFVLSSGDNIVIDLAWTRARVAVEVDHPYWHDREAEAARDKRRDRKLLAMGWATPRMTKWDVDHGLIEAVADLRALLEARGWQPGLAA